MSGLRRALGLHAGAAQGAFQVSSFVRLALIGGLLYWAAHKGAHLHAVPILMGLFLPEVIFLVRLYGVREEDSMP